ncbi:T9SS type B sorting domain-containing protein [Psychroserpens luteus]|uniref:Gliding motility-associated C-terminal domain-containing protein n=1 Tax=Psychroserpens luteus TaxID=1434066 RepID=A0ABW5ZX80_9FLAO|nr:gliding motility-associated C-terminal domain-containing protein [Psychroserpens luteus]
MKFFTLIITLFFSILFFNVSIAFNSIKNSTNNLENKSFCPAPILTSFSPMSGPENTLITITGSFFNDATSVTFDGIDASFTIINDSEMTTLVPAGTSNSSIISITSSGGCIGNATTSFSLITSECTTGELYISEIFDSETGSYGIIELYNPTNAVISLDGIYSVERYGDIGTINPSITIPLINTVGPEQTYIIQMGSTGTDCGVATDITTATGFNANDEFKLLKNNIVIDVTEAPDENGYTIVRNADAVVPSDTFIASDWFIDSDEDCSNLETHTADSTSSETPNITHPTFQNICANEIATFSVTVDSGTFSYQWKTLNASGNWVNVSNNTNYSGATTSTLTITNVPANFNGNQYYCEITSASCNLASNAALLQVNTSEVDVITDQNVCDNFTLPSITNGLYFTDTNGTGTQLNAGDIISTSQIIYIFNSIGTCTNESSFTVTITETPLVDTIENQTVCTEYTLPILTNGNYFTGPNGTGTTFNAGATINTSQTIYIYNGVNTSSLSCSNESSFDITIYPSTDFSLTEDNLVINEDTLTVTMADDTINYEYALDDGDFQSDNIFSNLPNGDYTLYVRDTNGCIIKSIVFNIFNDLEDLIIPNGFSPNDDGYNDWFNIQGLYDIYLNHDLEIYNRYGTLVFKGNNDNKWFGVANKGILKTDKILPTGTYFYILHLNDSNASTNAFNGWVYLNK